MVVLNLKISTINMSRDEWLEYRNSGLGGSDAGTVCGLNPWKSSLTLYLEKTKQIPEPEENEKMYWGNILEDIVAHEFSKRTGLKVCRQNSIIRSVENSFMLANIDRRIVGAREGLECKTSDSFMKKKWADDQIPDSYMAQIQHYMAVTGYDAWWIAVLIGGNDFRHQRIERDQEFINMLINIEANFWNNNVLAGVMPEADGSSSSSEAISKLFPNSIKGKSREIYDESAFEEFESYQALANQYSELKEQAANKIKLMLEDCERGESNRFIVNWKGSESNRLDSKALKKDHPEIYSKYCKKSQSRRFTITKTTEEENI